ncbi:MAG: hypothetical protein ABSD61_09185, partial [Terracidiphilus sp.]
MDGKSGFAAESNRHQAHESSAARLFLVLALAMPLYPLAAQQSAEPPSQQTTPRPGVGAQLHTGTGSGLDTDARLQNLLADHQYLRIQALLSQLPPGQSQFYRGILANRSNQLDQSVQLLEPLIDQVSASGDAAREKLIRMTLAEDYLRLGDWTKAGHAYQTLDARFGAKLTQSEQDEIEMPLKMLPLAKDNPPITVDPCESFRLQVSNDPLGLIDVPVF